MAIAVYNYCIQQKNIKIDRQQLLEGLEKFARTEIESCEETSFDGFHPCNFDRCIIQGIEDKVGGDVYTLKLKIKGIDLDQEINLNDSDYSDDSEGTEYPSVLWGNEKGLLTVAGHRINDWVFVVHFCKSEDGTYFSCVDKSLHNKDKSENMNDYFYTYPKIQSKPYYCLYKIKVEVFNMKAEKAKR